MLRGLRRKLRRKYLRGTIIPGSLEKQAIAFFVYSVHLLMHIVAGDEKKDRVEGKDHSRCD